tara:strand:+ start:281 stop:1648 length:1368 start_codon:yes stop_codon:yes gene_type:complete
MNIYPAIKMKMGDPEEGWTYYVIKMKMKDVGKEINFASEFSGSKTLNEVLQRQLNESRAKDQMANYLVNRKDRFYNSIVVAALEGSPTWIPLNPSQEDLENDVLEIYTEAAKHFGLLKFDGGQKYYALDGQHRVKSIQQVLDTSEEPYAPEGFENEEISVIIITVQEQAEEAWVRKYRRLFSSLNRYAKPVDRDTSIIMDEDDLIAIITRQMIEQYPFFLWDSNIDDSPKVKTKGNTMREGEPQFITIQTLYDFNSIVLKTSENIDQFKGDWKQIRPTDEVITEFYQKISMIWDALLEALPELRNDPTLMRTRNDDALNENSDHDNHLLFTPIGMKSILAPAIAYLLNRVDGRDLNTLIKEFKKFRSINWSLNEAPFFHVVSMLDIETGNWKMANEERTQRCALALDIVLWLVGVTDLGDDDIHELKIRWTSFSHRTSRAADEIWAEIENQKSAL